MSDDEPPVGDDEVPPEDDNVLVFRNPANAPVVVPSAVATEADRAFRCYQARVGGKSWAQIAEEENYPSAKAAKADVERYTAEARSLIAEGSMRDMLNLEVARLDALQVAFWGQATMGHVPSGRMILDIIKTRALFTGLDPEKIAENADQMRTVIIPSNDESYIARLQAAAGEELEQDPPGE